MRTLATIAAAVLVLVGAVVFLQEPAEQESPLEAAAAAATEKFEKLIRDRVIDLPEDGDKWHTTIVYYDPQTEADSAKLAAQFASTPRLQSLLAQTHVHTWTVKDPVWRARYAHEFQNITPGVIVQNADGDPVYKASGKNLPKDGEQLANEIAAAISSSCPNGHCPNPADRPRRPLQDKFIPDIRPQSLKGPKEIAMVAVLALVAGIIAHLLLRPPPKP